MPNRQGASALYVPEDYLSTLEPHVRAALRQYAPQHDGPVAVAPYSLSGALTSFPSSRGEHAPFQRTPTSHANTDHSLGGNEHHISNRWQKPRATTQHSMDSSLDDSNRELPGNDRSILRASYSTSVPPISSIPTNYTSRISAVSHFPDVPSGSSISRTFPSDPTFASSSRQTRSPGLNAFHFSDAPSQPLHSQTLGQQPSRSQSISQRQRQRQLPLQSPSPYFSASGLSVPETRADIVTQQPRFPPKTANRSFNKDITPVQSSSSPVGSGPLSSPAAQVSLRRNASQNPVPSSSIAPNRQLLALDHAPPIANGISLVNPQEVLPDRFRNVFPYSLFNAVQSKCFDAVYKTNNNLVISAPTGSGKTAILELAICKLAHSRRNGNFKIVYLSPLKALCSERASDWRRKFASLTMEVAELTGDTSQIEMARVRQASIVITTPEKWDSITRSWTDHRKLLDLVELFLIDEVHLLNDARGSTIEAVVSRMKIRGANVRFIALSATVPNSNDVAQWLGRDHNDDGHTPAHQEIFGEEFRPVKLQKFVYGFDKMMNDYQFDDFLNEQLYPHIAKHSQKKPILVFCYSRKSCQNAASKLAEEWNERQPQVRPWPGPRGQQRIPVISPELQEIVRFGVAFHHAGLDIQDRKAIEQAFLDGRLSVVCCTSTLAMGLNLPCHMVVLKGTKAYQEGRLEELSDLEVMQMLGRAGRPQFGNSAVAVVLTRTGHKRRYVEMGSSQQILESTLHQNLLEHLNSEISLGTFHNIQNAKHWLKGTFLAVRLCQNPSYYKLAEETSNTAVLDDKLEEICETDVSKLREAGLITLGDTFHSTDYGRAMSKFVIRFNSMKKILEIPRGAKMEQLLNTICEADEFKDCRWKSHERDVFRDLNKDYFIAYPIKETVNTTAHKVSLLIQVALGNVNLSNVPEYIRRPMIAETSAVLEKMHRLVRAVIECKISDSDGVNCRVALELERSMLAKAWEGRSVQLTQIPQVGPVLMRKFVAAGIATINSLSDAETGDIERIASRNPPFGKKVVDELEKFPKLTLETDITGDKPRHSGEMPFARIDATLGFSNTKGKPKWHGKIPSVTFMAETTEGKLAYWWRGSLRRFKEEDGNRLSLKFEVELTNYTEGITCHFSCDSIVGTIVSRTLHHNLPASAFPPKPESRKPGIMIPATTSWLDDEIEDGDLLEMVQESNYKDQHQDCSVMLEDEDLWPLVDRDGNIQRKEQGQATMKQRQRRPSQIDFDEEVQWQPIKLLNGKYKCNHHCADAGVKGGRACTHKCCRDGIDKPRRPKKASSKRKAEDDEVITDRTAPKPSELKALAKRTKTSDLRTEPKFPKYTPMKNLSTPASIENSLITDLDGFNVDEEGLIDLTNADSATDDTSVDRVGPPVPGCSQLKFQHYSPCNEPAEHSNVIFDGVSDDDLQYRFTSTLAGSGRIKGGEIDMHIGLKKRQSTSTDEFSDNSVFEGLAMDGSEVQDLHGGPTETTWANRDATSSSAETKHLNHASAKFQLDKTLPSPTKLVSSHNPLAYGRVDSNITKPEAPSHSEGEAHGGENFLGLPVTVAPNSIYGLHEQENNPEGRRTEETEEEALASMSDIFSAEFVDPSTYDAYLDLVEIMD
ncbi:ATP-dependent DNA helicase MER3 [Cytospora mali]|uniref:DNA 3'-5' helicase n=1 Tax=Cytospora mali TaxID=578113 RepID=A0A194VZS9_CYTMA|nr:ATP-dependent DNA helicase MER3 [Valsa mali]